MKKTIFLITSTILIHVVAHAQEAYAQQMQTTVTKLDNANTVKDYQELATNFLRIAEAQKTQWLPYYYAAFAMQKSVG